MISTLKLTSVGNSVGIILPKEILNKLGVEKGDSLYVIETPEGIELTAYRADFAAQIDAAEEIMRKNRDALKMLTR